MNEQIIARHWLALAAPKAAPALATSTVLILARIWNANGAEHSVGNAALMTALALGAAAAGAFACVGRAGDRVIAGTAFATSGGLALAGVAGYADGLSLPLLLWALATAVAYGLAARHWRTDRRDTRRPRAAHQPSGARNTPTSNASKPCAPERRSKWPATGAAYADALAQAHHRPRRPARLQPAALTRAGLPELPTIEITQEH